MQCEKPGCDARVEASAPLWLTLEDDGSWSVYGVGDEAAEIVCTEGHDNSTPVLEKSMSAFIEELLPKSTWVGSDER